jgi:hypothetical protein
MEAFIDVIPGTTHANSEILKAELIRVGVPRELINESIEKFLQGKSYGLRKISEIDPWHILDY